MLGAAQGAASPCKNTSCSHRWVQSMLMKTVVDPEEVKQSQNITVQEADTVSVDTKSNEMLKTVLI